MLEVSVSAWGGDEYEYLPLRMSEYLVFIANEAP